MRKIDVDPRRDKPEYCKPRKDAECDRHISPVTPKCPWKIFGKEPAYNADTLAFGTIDLAVGTNDEAVQVIDQFRVAGLGPCNRQVGCRTPVQLAEFAHLHLRQTAK